MYIYICKYTCIHIYFNDVYIYTYIYISVYVYIDIYNTVHYTTLHHITSQHIISHTYINTHTPNAILPQQPGTQQSNPEDVEYPHAPCRLSRQDVRYRTHPPASNTQQRRRHAAPVARTYT